METLHCGAGRADITPPVGTPMGGFANRASPCQGMLDPLFARALYLSTQDASTFIITLDALAISAERAQQLREIAATIASIARRPTPQSHIQIACSHTHSGIDLAGLRMGNSALRTRIDTYFALVCDAVQAAVAQACECASTATLSVGSTTCVIGRNRRLRPGHAAITDTERAQGTNIDQTLTVLRFTHAARDEVIATLFQIACHPVCLGPENVRASGDFVGLAAQRIEVHTSAPALFLNGAAGNITPLIGRGSSYDATRELAHAVANTALTMELHPEPARLLCREPAVAQLPLACHFEHAADIDAQAKWLLAQTTEFPAWPQVVAGWQSQMHAQLTAGQLPATIDIALNAILIGSTRFLFIGAEVFSEYQIWQQPGTRLVGYANGEVCYIPTAAALESGGYEVTASPVFYGLPCAPGAAAQPALLVALSACMITCTI